MKWKRKEEEKLIRAHNLYRGNWEQIAQAVGTDKKAKECRDRFKKINNEKDNKVINSNNWTELDI